MDVTHWETLQHEGLRDHVCRCRRDRHPWISRHCRGKVRCGAIGEALAAGWLTIANPGVEGSDLPLYPGVEVGECSTIALALLWQAAGVKVLVIVDDRYGRAEVRSQGVAIIGTAAALVLAKEWNLIHAGRGRHAEPFLVLQPGDETDLG